MKLHNQRPSELVHGAARCGPLLLFGEVVGHLGYPQPNPPDGRSKFDFGELIENPRLRGLIALLRAVDRFYSLKWWPPQDISKSRFARQVRIAGAQLGGPERAQTA